MPGLVSSGGQGTETPSLSQAPGLLLVGGTLGLSAALIGNIHWKPDILLMASWGAFVAAIILVLLLFNALEMQFDAEVSALDDALRNNEEAPYALLVGAHDVRHTIGGLVGCHRSACGVSERSVAHEKPPFSAKRMHIVCIGFCVG